MTRNYAFTISYGKMKVPLYRVYAQPLTGIPAIPESSFTGRPNTIFALEVDVEVFGNNFLPAYLVGDNRNVVATDSMKNFILRQGLNYTGSTFEGLLEMLGRRFLETYPQMERLQLRIREMPFLPVTLPAVEGQATGESAVLFNRSHNDFTTASMDFVRAGEGTAVTDHLCGRVGLELFKVTGSSFTHFVRDEYTTLPERVDRPLFIHLNVYWTYTDLASLLAPDLAGYVPAEQIRDLIQVVFDEFVSESIQHLVYEMGRRLLERFPQLASVTFDAQNHTRDLVVASTDDERVKVYTDPFNAFGNIKLTLKAEDIQS
ncbi:MAG TPA: urate oxidase [Ktedonobacteraceae bacterium]|jgi:urate oxidase|nr:urate oxidase [Ktedonobacteraceae bacterium]